MTISKTIQVDHEGTRVTAHFVKTETGEWEFRDLGANVERLPRDAVGELMAAVLADEKR